LASTLRWRIVTPFGSAVAPDVKMIWIRSSREIVTSGIGPSACQSRSANFQTVTPATSAAAVTSSPASITRASTSVRTRPTNSADDR
jgi:hypothetical protein